MKYSFTFILEQRYQQSHSEPKVYCIQILVSDNIMYKYRQTQTSTEFEKNEKHTTAK